MLRRALCLFLAVIFTLPFLFCPVTAFAAFGELSLSAQSGILLCADDGEVLFEKNAHTPLPMASTTKIMTCLVALEKGDLTKTVEVSPHAVGVEGTSLYLQKGDCASLCDLLYAVMLRSANDAAAAVAYHIGGTMENFVSMMNEKANELGMKNTHFANPHGLPSEEHYTTAYDFAVLGAYAMKNPVFSKIVSTTDHTVSINSGKVKKPIVNHNKLLRLYDGANGIKTGFTKDSGRCLVSSATRDGVNLIAVTFNAPNDWNDHISMLNYGFSRYHTVTVMEMGSFRRTFDVVGGTIEVSNTEEVKITLKKEAEINVLTEIPRLIFPPVKKGDAIGEAVVYVDGKEYKRVPLVSDTEIAVTEEPKISFFDRIGILHKN